jgi:hypothetical protein
VTRNIQGKAIDTLAKPYGKPKSRVAEKEPTKSTAKKDDKSGSEQETAHNATESPVPEEFGDHIRAHEDRLTNIETHLGMKHKADDMKNQDQAEPKSGKEAGHSTVRTSARKRH